MLAIGEISWCFTLSRRGVSGSDWKPDAEPAGGSAMPYGAQAVCWAPPSTSLAALAHCSVNTVPEREAPPI
jgi:hypothetical protein